MTVIHPTFYIYSQIKNIQRINSLASFTLCRPFHIDSIDTFSLKARFLTAVRALLVCEARPAAAIVRREDQE